MISAIAGRELRSLFLSPLAWSLLSVASFILAWLFLVQMESFVQIQPQLKAGSATLGVSDLVIAPLMDSAGLIFLLLTPLLSMRLLSEEYRNGTIRLLFASPLPASHIVLGKYLAQLVLCLPLLLITALMPLSLLLGSEIDIGRTLAALFGLTLLVACYSAVGLLMSSLTEQPAVAAIATYGVLLLLWMLNRSHTDEVSALFDWLSLTGHYRPFISGVVRSGDVAYFLILILASLLLTHHQLEYRRSER